MGAQDRADLHLHTSASDGLRSPAEVVREASRLGLGAIAIADHDTVAGIPEARREALILGVTRVVPAVEVNTDYLDTEVHVLGYWPDLDDRDFAAFLERQVRSREERARLMVARLAELGLPVSWERVKELAAGGVIGRPHVAAALAERGHASDFDDAMTRLLGRGRPGYVPRHKLLPHDAVRAIALAGGVPVLAHPGTTGRDSLIDELVPLGLAGLEARHPRHTPAQARRYVRMARARRLVVTGGSDYHGPPISQGVAIGDVTVSILAVSELLERLPPRGPRVG